MTLAEKIISFHQKLAITHSLPEGVEFMHPFKDVIAYDLASKFYKKYYSDNSSRILILGINPGRFGGGVTGIPFTDPIKLENYCGIPNDLAKKAELSADFIYQMILAYGGPDKFYSRFYISAISPLGFIKDGKNLNYYDIPALQEGLHHFIITSLSQQIGFGLNTEVCFCLGEGQNFKFLDKLNNTYNFFNKIIPLPHPRFIMQYKRKQLAAYIQTYIHMFS